MQTQPQTTQTPTDSIPNISGEPIPGLENVLLADTRLSRVDGQRGELVIAGYPLEHIAPYATFEDMIHLLWTGRRATRAERIALGERLAQSRALPEATLALLRGAAEAQRPPMDALRMAAASLDLGQAQDDDALAFAIVAGLSSLVATFHRLRQGLEPVAPRQDLDHAAHFLYQLTGDTPRPEAARALATYLNTVVDHGLNASTFTARVITSTGSDLLSAVVGAMGALAGPLHGGAPGPALDMVLDIARPERAEPVLREKLERGERLMGFGHRVYKVRDPRAEVLGQAAEQLYASGDDPQLYALTRHVERVAVDLLAEYKPGRRLEANVELYTALLLHGLGLPNDLFTPVFAMGRAVGWIAHCHEQRTEGRLIRPRLRYTGAADGRWSRDSLGG